MTVGFIRRTNEEWLELYNRQRSSGMTVKDWCAVNEIKLATMADRITRLRKLGMINEPKPTRGKNSDTGINKKIPLKEKKQKNTWVEAVPVPVADTGGNKGDESISIIIGNYKVEVRKGFEPGTLISVCKALVTL